ncbi:hypothetical protein [Nocardioides sp.]|uniref:hypothetical protein n=1 Tax=Nocardioides sp. TaxID=35761 RepID=UPI0031FE70C7
MSTDDGIREPVPRHLHALLRRAALDHAVSERRKVYLPLIHVGLPGRQETVFAVRPEELGDHALRADLIAAMLRRVRGDRTPIVWLTRTGSLELQDVDAQWLAGARTAYAETGAPLTMVVVNRRGWRDPRSGVGRTWSRLRAR